jgi:hypothetical protein
MLPEMIGVPSVSPLLALGDDLNVALAAQALGVASLQLSNVLLDRFLVRCDRYATAGALVGWMGRCEVIIPHTELNQNARVKATRVARGHARKDDFVPSVLVLGRPVLGIGRVRLLLPRTSRDGGHALAVPLHRVEGCRY